MAVLFSTFIIYIISFLFAYLALKLYRSYKQANNDSNVKLPPCLPSLPLVGSLFILPARNMKDLPMFFMNKSKVLGDIFAFYMCNRYVVVLNGKNCIYEAFVKHSFNFASRPVFYLNELFNPKLAGIIEHLYDDHFKLHHKISLNILRHFGFGQGIMESRIKIEVDDLVERIKLKNGQPFNPAFEFTAAVSNVISSIIFGKGWSKDDPEFHEGLELIHAMVKTSTKTMLINFFPILRFLPNFKSDLKYINGVMKNWDCYIERVVNRVLKENEVENFCSMYMDEIKKIDKTNVDNDQFIFMIRDLFLAGTETTATTLLWFIYLMANNQEIQKKVQKELDSVVGFKRIPSLDDKQNLPLTEAAILEVMRFKTLVPLALPHLTLRDTVINGVFIPKDVMVMPNIYSAHMNSLEWDEPERFKIERFLNDDQTEAVNREMIVSFSLGKRSCLGELLAKQEIFLFAATLIQNFNILPLEGEKEIVAEELMGETISPSDFEARLIPRN